ncbi:hypothetical protein OHF10_25565, partial [Escherichia coli]|nr:hypothetical protein [Escherichia coli]
VFLVILFTSFSGSLVSRISGAVQLLLFGVSVTSSPDDLSTSPNSFLMSEFSFSRKPPACGQ